LVVTVASGMVVILAVDVVVTAGLIEAVSEVLRDTAVDIPG
jgi:hypothetical protein